MIEYIGNNIANIKAEFQHTQQFTLSKDISLDEIIELQQFDLNTITIQEMSILQEALKRKKRQELRWKHKKKKFLHEIKDVLFDAFGPPEINESKPIIEKLVTIVDRIKNEDLNSNVKLLEWLERKFHIKVIDNISSAIALKQVDLETKIESVKIVLDNIVGKQIVHFY